LICEKKGKIVYLTLNRPEVHNAINAEGWDRLIRAWQDFGDDPDIWAAVITGAGKKAFCAGNDLIELSAWYSKPQEQRSNQPLGPIPVNNPLRGIKNWKPVVAAINGICSGTGLELALACDIRIAAETAKFAFPEVKLGGIPANSGTQRIVRLMPFGKGLELLLTGQFMDAHEAHRWGLVNRVVPLDNLMAEASAFAEQICENAPIAVRAAKEAAYRGIETSFDEGLRLEMEIVRRIGLSEDGKEGPKAFAEKRKPTWKGR
jgi:E-phenylitaconyl-CoA hydratase